MRRIQGAMSARMLFDRIDRDPRCHVTAEAILLPTEQQRSIREAALAARVAIVREALMNLVGPFVFEMAKEIESALARQTIGSGWERP